MLWRGFVKSDDVIRVILAWTLRLHILPGETKGNPRENMQTPPSKAPSLLVDFH